MEVSKLYPAQKYVIEKAHKEIDLARIHTIIEWATYEKFRCENIEDSEIAQNWNKYGYNSLEEALNCLRKSVEDYGKCYGKYYENAKNGIVTTTANPRTLKSLERFGLIEIMNGGRGYVYIIKILNY